MIEDNGIALMRQFILSNKKEIDLALDLTLGKGEDSKFILDQNPKAHVMAFDIQEKALNLAQEKLKDTDCFQGILDGHENLDKYVKEPVDLCMMNLGYLPGGNKEIITKAKTTCQALEKALKLLKEEGLCTILAYRSHPGAKEEVEAVEDFLKALDQREFIVQRIEFYNQIHEPPIFFGIQKRKKK